MSSSSSSFVGKAGSGTCGTETWPDGDVQFGGKIEGEEWLERVDHPLLNDVILKLMFGHVRRFDLKACRSVCKKWNEHTIPHIRSTFQVTIHGNKSKDKNSETRRIVDFVKLFKSNDLGIPFENYRLGPFRTTDGAGKQFLEICGESIKEIILFQPSAPCVRTIENVSELLKFSPKLEALTIRGQFVSRSRNVVKLFPADSTETPVVLSALKKLTLKIDSRKSVIKYCPTFFDELLTVAKISDLTSRDIGYNTKDSNPKSGTTLVLNSIEKLGKESSIECLTLKSGSLKHVKILKRMAEKPNGLKLKRLSFHPTIPLGEKGHSTLQLKLATMFKDTLEDFYVIGGKYPRKIHLTEFPIMAKLKYLKFDVLEDLGHKPVYLNSIFPVLETLNIDFDYFKCDGSDGDTAEDNLSLQFFSQFQFCPTLNTLIMDQNVTNVHTFRNFSRVFPNLCKLTLNLSGEDAERVLRLIFTRMTQLEALSVVAYIYVGSRDVLTLDSVITGISIQGLKQIRPLIPDLEKMTVEERRERISSLVEQYGSNNEPSIRNLINLTHLKLDVRGGYRGHGPIPSDLTGYLGIYFLKHLKHLDIGRSSFTKTCCQILTMETGAEAWRFQFENQYDTHNIYPPFQLPYSEPGWVNYIGMVM